VLTKLSKVNLQVLNLTFMMVVIGRKLSALSRRDFIKGRSGAVNTQGVLK